MRGQVPGGLRMIIINNKPPPGRPGEGGMRGAVATAAERSPRPRPAVVQSGGPPPAGRDSPRPHLWSPLGVSMPPHGPFLQGGCQQRVRIDVPRY